MDDIETKMHSYSVTEEFMDRFIRANKSVVCRELLGYDLSINNDLEQIKEKNLFNTFCPEMVRNAVNILEEMIAEGLS